MIASIQHLLHFHCVPGFMPSTKGVKLEKGGSAFRSVQADIIQTQGSGWCCLYWIPSYKKHLQGLQNLGKHKEQKPEKKLSSKIAKYCWSQGLCCCLGFIYLYFMRTTVFPSCVSVNFDSFGGQRWHWVPETEGRKGYEPVCGCWDLNPGPL